MTVSKVLQEEEDKKKTLFVQSWRLARELYLIQTTRKLVVSRGSCSCNLQHNADDSTAGQIAKYKLVMAPSIPNSLISPPPPPGHLSGICLFFQIMLQMPHGGVSS